MFSRLGGRFARMQSMRRTTNQVISNRKFGAGPATLESLHTPKGYEKLGTFCLLTCYLWIMYKFKEDQGQLFGMYKPWLHPHEHHHHTSYEFSGDHSEMPALVDHHHDDEEEEEH